jgi:hypothetical protein
MNPVEIRAKFAKTEPLRFICAGWVTTEGDGGILRSFQLIRRLWPTAEIHLCLTQFMPPDHPQIAPLVAYVQSQSNGYVHSNLQDQAYKELLNQAHIGLNLHDPNVFGEAYRDFSLSMVQRCPSARVLDFATRGCILMTTAEQRFAEHMFRQVSPHGVVLYLSAATQAELLPQVFAQLQERLSA